MICLEVRLRKVIFMKGLKEKKVGTALGLAFITLFTIIFLAISFYVVDSHLHKYPDFYYRFYSIRK